MWTEDKGTTGEHGTTGGGAVTRPLNHHVLFGPVKTQTGETQSTGHPGRGLLHGSVGRKQMAWL